MSHMKPENPRVFPLVWPEGDRDVNPGLSLRDFFAAAAISSIVSGTPVVTLEVCAKCAYALADAMLAARGGQEA